ncbi:hypothetical protein [Nonomuraea sp. NPDC049695]
MDDLAAIRELLWAPPAGADVEAEGRARLVAACAARHGELPLV